ncbi:hypothetical protein [Lewinella cohaerens]|uniref:hypothetical protein n=1 Tax=Lewinella cohaerens TaxID=70995 RepID=UPI00037ABB31|nr:hypothetical protein [Lewinella cohaerens]
MKRFILKLVLFCLLVITPYFYLQYTLMKAHDPFYWKATGKADHLVLGGSRALKGVFPHVISKELQLEGEMLNFAFTGVLSPYGDKYFSAIKRKLKPATENGIFILSVSPGSIMDFSDAIDARENNFRFYKLWGMNQHPNIEYVLRHPRSGSALLVEWLSEEREAKNNVNRVFQNGANGTYLPEDFKPKSRAVVMHYDMEKSPVREASLAALIRFLSERGHVFLVRVPVSHQIREEENLIYPFFDEAMSRLCHQKKDIWYFDYTDSIQQNTYRFSDGYHHLEGNSSDKFSRALAKDIKKALQND